MWFSCHLQLPQLFLTSLFQIIGSTENKAKLMFQTMRSVGHCMLHYLSLIVFSNSFFKTFFKPDFIVQSYPGIQKMFAAYVL